LLLREQPDQQHQQPPLSLLPIVLGSCSGYDFDRLKRTSSAAVYDGIDCEIGIGSDFSQGGRCISVYRRILLRQVHSLCFHAYYGCAQ
jgi:hypothetical protein